MKTIQCKVKTFFIEVIAGYGTVVGNNGGDADVPETSLDDFITRGLVHPPKGHSAMALDHDNNGKPGGSLPSDPPALVGKNKAALLAIAADEQVVVADGATNAEIVAAIEAKRAAPAADTAGQQNPDSASTNTDGDTASADDAAGEASTAKQAEGAGEGSGDPAGSDMAPA